MLNRMYQWYILRKPDETNITDSINRAGYGPCEQKDNKILLGVQWTKKNTITIIVNCSCDYVVLHNETALVILEPYSDGKLIIKQFDKEKNELPNG